MPGLLTTSHREAGVRSQPALAVLMYGIMGSFFKGVLGSLEHVWLSALSRLETHADAVTMAVMASIIFGLMAGTEYWGGHPERIPITTLYVGSWLLMFGLPVMLVWSHRRRQQQVITRGRGLYALAMEWLTQGRDREAQQVLRSIRRWEQHWRIGNSSLYRLAYSAFVICATTLVAALHYLAYANLYSLSGYGQVAHKSLTDTVGYLLEHPIQLWGFGILSLIIGLSALEKLKDLAGAPWSEFYGDRLQTSLKAGRTINEAPWHGKQLPHSAVSTRELLGLSEKFTSADLRRAWLKLARELHPDLWATAGEGVQKMKEAALKRVNAARDELAVQVAD